MAFSKGKPDVDFPAGPEDTISALRWSPVSNHVAAACWDGKVYIFDANNATSTAAIKGVAAITASAPFFDCDFSKDGTMAAGASADQKIYIMDLASSQTMTLEGHRAPVRTVRYVDIPSANAPILASGSWDKTIRYWDLRQPNPIGAIQLTERVYAMDAAGPLLVAATADNQVHHVNLRGNPLELSKSVKSPLSNQARDVSVCADGSRWAISGIDGRAAAQKTDDKDTKFSNLSFKCHRNQLLKHQTDVYAVHAVSFSPAPNHKNDVLATAGGDGTLSIWDVRTRQRLHTTSPSTSTTTTTTTLGSKAGSAPVTAATFNRDGSAVVYAVGYDWAKGYRGNESGAVRKIVLHPVAAGVFKK